MQTIAVVAPDAAGGHAFEGAAQIFARLSVPGGADEVAVLQAFAEAAGRSSRLD